MVVSVNEIKPNPNNPRLIKGNKFKKLVKSIQEFPEMQKLRAIIVDENMMVLGGNMRLKACIHIGLKKVYIDKFTKKMANEMNLLAKKEARSEKTYQEYCNEFIIKDNSNFGEWDFDVLANEWDLKGLDECGLDLPPMFNEVLEAEEDDYKEPIDLKVDVVLGDLIEIGEHRLLCGDSTDSDQVAKLMNGKKADIAFTSPPYNVGLNAKLSFYKKEKDNKYIDGYNDNNPNYKMMLQSTLENQILFSKYIFINLQMLANNKIIILEWLEKNKKLFADVLIWNKEHAQPSMAYNVLNSVFEFIFIFSKKANRSIGTKKFRGTLSNVYSSPPQRNNDYANIHNATFPIHLPEFLIKNFINKNKTILDVFLGTGTTMVAAHQLKRKCYGMDLDPKYCQVIIDRMIKLDSNLIVKINDKIYGQK